MNSRTSWREIALTQAGLITRAQLTTAGVNDRRIERFIASERWQRLAPNVIGTTTGELTGTQRMWLGTLHGGTGALVAGVHALARAGLRNWDRATITIITPYREGPTSPLEGFVFIRTRRPLARLRGPLPGPPTCAVDPAALLFASRERNPRTWQGLLAAAVQQQLTSPHLLAASLHQMRPLRQARHIAVCLDELAGGAQSTAELDVARMCRAHGLSLPRRQTRRRDAAGRNRYTDCEWLLPDGRTLVLEVDGLFHMEVEHWEDDLARQRALSATDRVIVHCTSRELKRQPGRVAADLRRLGVPLAA